MSFVLSKNFPDLLHPNKFKSQVEPKKKKHVTFET